MDWDNFSDPYTCSVCGIKDAVPASGSRQSPILVVGAYPGDDEVKKGKPMVGKMGGVFRTELAYAGIDMSRLRLCNLWHHVPPPQDSETYEKCFQEGLRQVLDEAKDKKVILLIGAETVKFFCDENVSDVNGLLVKSAYLSAPTIFAMVQPAMVFHGGLGEVRLSIQKFSKIAGGLL